MFPICWIDKILVRCSCCMSHCTEEYRGLQRQQSRSPCPQDGSRDICSIRTLEFTAPLPFVAFPSTELYCHEFHIIWGLESFFSVPPFRRHPKLAEQTSDLKHISFTRTHPSLSENVVWQKRVSPEDDQRINVLRDCVLLFVMFIQ